MKIAFFNLNCILRDRLLSRKIVTVYGGLCPAVTPVWSPPLLRKGLYMNLLTECTQLVLHLGPPLHSFPFLLLILITLREHSSDFECKSSTASQWFLSRLDFLDLQLYLDFFFIPLFQCFKGGVRRMRMCRRREGLFACVQVRTHLQYLTNVSSFISQTNTKKIECQTSEILRDWDTCAV